MNIQVLEHALTVCKVRDKKDIDMEAEVYFIGKTDEELSLVCRTEDAPASATDRSDGWRGFRVCGVLDFSLTGILAELSGILADEKIGIFTVSTYNTDYILVNAGDLDRAISALAARGHIIV